MRHQVKPMDAYDNLWRCEGCGEHFESASGWALCPNSEVRGVVRKFGNLWFHFVSIDGEPHLRGQVDSWREAFNRVSRNVSALRPHPMSELSWDDCSSAHS